MENTLMMRLQTRDGIKRINLSKRGTVSNLKELIEREFGVLKKDQTLSIRRGTTTLKIDDGNNLSDYNIQNGDLVILLSNTPHKTSEKENIEPKHTITTINKGELVTTQAKESNEVLEDEIDQTLHKMEGWTIMEDTKRGYRTPDDYIAPWSIQKHPKWADLKIKHIPFHSWVREKAYRSGSNTQPSLVEDTFKVAKRGQLTGADLLQSTVTITRQPYRHVDSVLFEHKQVVEPLIDGWRRTGLQRCGYLIGKYVPDESIPLGITAQVAAIYEPPQMSNKTESLLLKDPKSDIIDDMLLKLNLHRVGFIWTRLPVDETKQLKVDRDLSSPLEAKEMTRMAHLQVRHPNPWTNARDGKFGSKFVSVLLASGKENTVEIEAYQMSNQGVALVKEKIIKPAKNNPTAFRVATSNDQFLYPDILYSDKDEYGNVVVKKADPFFPSNYFIIGVRHGFPKQPKSTFKTYTFPIENRSETTTWHHVKRQLEGKTEMEFVNALNDFHLLHFLVTNDIDMELLDRIIKAIKEPTSVSISKLRKDVGQLLEKFITPTPSQSRTVTSITNNKNTELIHELLIMGYTESQAQEAIMATGGTSIEAAVNYLLK